MQDNRPDGLGGLGGLASPDDMDGDGGRGYPRTIYVHFENRADMEAFSRLIGRRVTGSTRVIWYEKKREK